MKYQYEIARFLPGLGTVIEDLQKLVTSRSQKGQRLVQLIPLQNQDWIVVFEKCLPANGNGAPTTPSHT